MTKPNPYVRAGFAIALLSLAACTIAPVSKEQMAVARKAVERAGGTPEVAQWAPIELDQARAKISQAEQAMHKMHYATARRLADEAEADARLAEAHAQAMRNQRAVAEVREALNSLREELARHPG